MWDCGGSDALSLHKHTDHKVQLSDVENKVHIEGMAQVLSQVPQVPNPTCSPLQHW